MQGSDGKFYRVDLRNNCVFDQDEVFDVVPSQISLVQTSQRNSRIQSAKGSKFYIIQKDILHIIVLQVEIVVDFILDLDLTQQRSFDAPYN
jgi:hypothetical protein